jgi:hypothetical protein
MTQYIDKAALVAEIEKRKKEAESNCGGYKSYDEHRCDSCIVGFYEEFLEILDTLEVKEVQEEPVSEDLANAAIEYCGGDKGSDARVRAAFVVGANWKKEQIMKNNFSMEVFYETEWDDIHKFLRKNLNGEKVKLVIIKE